MKKTFLALFLVSFVFLTNAYAQNRGDGWPPANILQEFGIPGMPLPTGASEISWRRDWEQMEGPAWNMTGGKPAMRIGITGTNATGTAIKNWFESNGWKLLNNDFRANGFYIKGNSGAYYMYNDSEGQGQIVARILAEDFDEEYYQ